MFYSLVQLDLGRGYTMQGQNAKAKLVVISCQGSAFGHSVGILTITVSHSLEFVANKRHKVLKLND